MQSIIEKLNENLKVAYRQAVDADNKLDQLQKEGHGKFAALFAKDEVFGFEAKRFKPYVLDIAADVDALSQQDELDQQKLKTAVVKLQKVLELLSAFK